MRFYLSIGLLLLLVAGGSIAAALHHQKSQRLAWFGLPAFVLNRPCPYCREGDQQLYRVNIGGPVMQVYCPHCHSWRSEKLTIRAEAQ